MSAAALLVGHASSGAETIQRDAAAVHAMTGPGNEMHSFSSYLTGFEGNAFLGFYERRSYFAFDLSGISEPITEATLTVWSPPPLPINNFTGGYRSSRNEETFQLHEVLTPASTIAAIPFSERNTEGVVEVWEDLGDGPVFGSIVMTEDDEPLPDGKDTVVNLNAAVIASLNDAVATGDSNGSLADWVVGGIVVEGDVPFVAGNWQLFGGAAPYYSDPRFRAPLPVLTLVTGEAPQLGLGDYNDDGKVDQFDYDLWRQTFSSTADLRADGNGDQIVNAADYPIWRDTVGTMTMTPVVSGAAVPEPSALALLIGLAAGLPRVRQA